MTEHDREELLAYQRAGHEAYQAVAVHGQQIGGSIVRGAFEAWLLAHVAIHGWEATFEMVRQQSRGKYVPPRGSFLHLAVSNSAELTHNHIPRAS